jgi:enamine deaminase RidA (YjgF/YER057c/UK114 family)
MRQLVSTGSQYEKELGYSRAVRVGDTVHVSGCSGLLRTPGAERGNASEQFLIAAGKLGQTLEKAGARLEDVVMTRVYITRPEDWEMVGQAHGGIFGDIRPASSMVQVVRLIDPDMLVEIEATAIIDQGLGTGSA